MYKARMNHKIASLLLVSGSCLFSGMSFALPTDGTQLLHINSERLTLDVFENRAIYQGDVYAKQGSRQLWGNKLVIQRSTQGQLESVTTYGAPAKTQSMPKPEGAVAVGQANTIYYFPVQNLVRYQGDVIVKQSGNIFKGEVFDYNTQTQLITGPSTEAEQSTIILPAYNQNKLLNHEQSTTSSTSQ